MPPNVHRAADEGVAEEARARGRCQAPVLGRELKACDAADRRDRAEQRAARAQDSVGVPYCRRKIEDVLEGLSEDEAVKELVGMSSAAARSATKVAVWFDGSISSTSLRSTASTEALGVIGVQQLETRPRMAVRSASRNRSM